MRAVGCAWGAVWCRKKMTHLQIEGPPLWVLLVIIISVLIVIIGGLTCCVIRSFYPANTVGVAYETTGEGKLTSIPRDSGLFAIQTVEVPKDDQQSAQARGQRLQNHGPNDEVRKPTMKR